MQETLNKYYQSKYQGKSRVYLTLNYIVIHRVNTVGNLKCGLAQSSLFQSFSIPSQVIPWWRKQQKTYAYPFFWLVLVHVKQLFYIISIVWYRQGLTQNIAVLVTIEALQKQGVTKKKEKGGGWMNPISLHKSLSYSQLFHSIPWSCFHKPSRFQNK